MVGGRALGGGKTEDLVNIRYNETRRRDRVERGYISLDVRMLLLIAASGRTELGRPERTTLLPQSGSTWRRLSDRKGQVKVRPETVGFGQKISLSDSRGPSPVVSRL